MNQDINISPHLKVDINGEAFTTISGNFQITRDLVPRTGTEDAPGGTRVKPSTLRRIQGTLVTQRDPDAGYFAAPLNFFGSDSVWLRIWFNGRGDTDNMLDIPAFVVGSLSGDWNMSGSAAQQVTLQGENDGDFEYAGGVV